MKFLYENVVPIQTGELDRTSSTISSGPNRPSLVEIGVRLDEQGNIAVAGGVWCRRCPVRLAAMTALADQMDDLPPLGELLASGEYAGSRAGDALCRHPL